MSRSPIILPNSASAGTEADPDMLGMHIKQENATDDDILLFGSEMDVFHGTSTTFPIEELINSAGNIPDNISFAMQGLEESQLSYSDNIVKYDLDQLCNDSFKPAHTIKYKIHNGKHIKVWECAICSKEFGHQYTLMRHLPTHTDERKFQCNTCGKAFRQMSTLSQHRAIHSAERPYICEICHKTFNRVSTLISHRKTHTGLKPHRCHLCNKAFHQKGNLRNHIFTHTNERPYKCDVCSKGFNQMSNLMCHKMKAHQRVDKPRYVCRVCGIDFPKRITLRNHEQYQHGLPGFNSNPATPTRVKYTNGVLVEPITTAAMKLAVSTNQTPFALLRPLNGIPVLVRVLAAGDKQMLVPATAEDLKKHGQISITAQEERNKKNCEQQEFVTSQSEKDEQDIATGKGSTVQIKIPVVATVVQRCGKDGRVCMAVRSPGPNSEESDDNYTFTTTTENNKEEVDFSQALENSTFNNFTEENNMQSSSQIQFLDECGNILNEDTKNSIFQQFQRRNHVFSTTLGLENKVFIVPENNQSMIEEMGHDNIMNINYVDTASAQIFEMLEKPQVISLSETENVLDSSNVLYGNNNIGNRITIA